MHRSFKSKSLVSASLLLSLISPLPLPGTTPGTSIAQAQAPTPQARKATANVEGTWTITEAKTLDGRNYTGTVAIQPVGQIYGLSWQTSVGNQSGIAFLENGHLFGGWGTDEAAGYGIVVYKIGKDGTLDGRWTYSKNGGEIGTEIATGGRPNQIEGDYQVTGTNPNEAGQYKGILNIRKKGDTYQLTWTVGTSYRGVGIRSGDWLVVSWGQSGQFGVIDYAISGDKASGRSALFNQSSLSVENLVRSQASANLSLSCTLAQTPTSQDRKAEADCLLEQGIKQIDSNRFQVALQPLQQALAIYREIQDRQGQGQTLKNLGNAYSRLKDYARAIEYQQEALALAREIRDRDLEARALFNIGVAYRELGELAKATDYSQQSLAIAQAIQSREVEWKALNNLGMIYASLKDYTKAIDYQQQVLAIAKELQNRDLEWTALTALVSSYDSLKDHQKVIEFAQQGLMLAQETQNREWESAALITLSSSYASVFLSEAHNSLGDSQLTVELAQQSLALAQEVNNRNLESAALIDLSIAYSPLKDYQKMIDFAQESLAIAQEIKNRNLEAKALRILAFAYWALRDYQKGIEYGQQALAIYRELNDRSFELWALHNLNTNYIYLGDYQKVIELSQQELALAREIKDYDLEGVALVYLGFAYYAQGDSQKIIEYGQQALAVGRERRSPMAEQSALLALSVGYSNLGNNEKALEFSQASLAIPRDLKNRNRLLNNSEELALNTLGSLYRKIGQKEKAIAAYRETLAIDNGHFTAQVGLARIYSELNMPVTAITYYKQGISSVEQIRGKILGLDRQLQESFLQAFLLDADRTKNTDIYRELADLLLLQGRILEAQQVLELLKVQELRDFTKDTRSGDENPQVALNQTEEEIKKENGSLIAFGQKIYECQQTRCNQLSQLLDQRDALMQQFNQKIQTIEKQVRDRRATDDAFLDPNKLGLKAKEIVEAQPGTVLIYPLVLEDKIWLLWASKGGIIKSVEVPKVGQKQLAETVLKFRQLLQTPNSNIAELQATGKQLYGWLIKPIEPELKENKIQNLVFSLDRAARYIPMSALFDGEKYLIENYAVSTVLSAELTNTSDRLPPGTQNTPILAVGLSNAISGFNPLPNVPAELDAIVRKQPNDTNGIYPGLEFLNKDFDFRSLRDNLLGHKLLHIATHGEFVPGSPDASYLLLGTGEKLPIPKIATLQDLGNVSLVVLSACETALAGSGQDGTEINGISYYFLNAGAKAVMASLWKVNDDSTRQLMQNFYGNLAKGTTTAPITKAHALRQAQLTLLRGNSSKTDNLEQRSSLAPEARPGSPTASTDSSVSGFSHPYYWAPFILIGNNL
jgi:CHAT domain-containing protein